MRSNNTTLRTTCELGEFKARKTQATFFNQKPPTTPPPKTLRCTPHPSTHANPEYPLSIYFAQCTLPCLSSVCGEPRVHQSILNPYMVGKLTLRSFQPCMGLLYFNHFQLFFPQKCEFKIVYLSCTYLLSSRVNDE